MPTPAASTGSTDSNSTDLEDEANKMKEAEEGGSEILPETSTSKLSASLGMPEVEFVHLKEEDPMASLKLLLTKKPFEYHVSNSPSVDHSNPSSSEINS
ncbi:hypothetical protein A2U01_0064192, partial [Trifolium medium]|nr:hypothetical protein [Trifolium medium]